MRYSLMVDLQQRHRRYRASAKLLITHIAIVSVEVPAKKVLFLYFLTIIWDYYYHSSIHEIQKKAHQIQIHLDQIIDSSKWWLKSCLWYANENYFVHMIILISTDMTVVVVNLDFCTFLSFCITFLLSLSAPHFNYYLLSLSILL